MTLSGWIQCILLLGGIVLITKPMGLYLLHILDPEREGGTFLERFLGPLERLIYKLIRVDPKQAQTWWQYTASLLIFTVLSMLATYFLLRFQDKLPGQAVFNPAGLPGVPEHLAFNTAASFVTNTNWQSYGGESTMTYLSQMVALVMQHFYSFAVGVAVAAVLVRGIVGVSAKTIGNFWKDMVRLVLYLELPICLVFALFLVSQGVPQNFSPYTRAKVLDQTAGTTQLIAQGPVASMIAIKMQGTNGGGYMNTNDAHPYENPTPLSNFLQIMIFISVPTGLTYYLGRMVKNQRHGWAVWGAMFIIFVGSTLFCWHFEAAGNPRLTELGVATAADGNNMEGKEVRFGIFNSAFWANATTDTGCGAVNAMHDSFTPLGGLIPLLNIELGEVVFGGTGAGLYGMLIFVFVAIFLAGLMIGRTPEYLGKKIDAGDVKLASLMVLVTALGMLIPTAAAVINAGGFDFGTGGQWGTIGMNNAGPHGLSEVLYCFSEGTGNNGSAFAGLTMNPVSNTILGFVILFGRYFPMIAVLALAGRLVRKKVAPIGPGNFPVSGGTFIVLLISTVLIVGALTFFPALALGPIVEHFLMHAPHVTF